MKCADKKSIAVIAIFFLLLLTGCDRMMTSRHTQLIKDAETKSGQGDFLRAVSLYEAALDDSPQCAEVHYKLGLLYDDKMKDPLSALHHFKRYLVLSPDGSHASEVKGFMQHDEIALVTTLSGDSVVSRSDATRLRNENLNLRRELEERNTGLRTTPEKSQPRESNPGLSQKAGGQSYVVRQGDTLVSISRKFYKTPARWKTILDANRKNIDDPERLKIGQAITIP